MKERTTWRQEFLKTLLTHSLQYLQRVSLPRGQSTALQSPLYRRRPRKTTAAVSLFKMKETDSHDEAGGVKKLVST